MKRGGLFCPARACLFIRWMYFNVMKRLPYYLLLVGMVIIIVHYYGQKPVEVDVVVHFGSYQSNLNEIDISYHYDQEFVAKIQRRYQDSHVPERFRHRRLKLKEGRYRVEIQMQHRDRSHPVTLTRSIDVQREGTYDIYLKK